MSLRNNQPEAVLNNANSILPNNKETSHLPVFPAARHSANSISFMPNSFKNSFLGRCSFKNVTKAERVLSFSLGLTCLAVLILFALLTFLLCRPEIILKLVRDTRCLSPVCVSAGNFLSFSWCNSNSNRLTQLLRSSKDWMKRSIHALTSIDSVAVVWTTTSTPSLMTDQLYQLPLHCNQR